MPRKPRTRQIWKCKVCGQEYHSPIQIKAAYCHKPHPRNQREMKLVSTDDAAAA